MHLSSHRMPNHLESGHRPISIATKNVTVGKKCYIDTVHKGIRDFNTSFKFSFMREENNRLF